MQRKHFVFVLVILSLLIPSGTVLANTLSESRLKIVSTNSSDEPVVSTPDPSADTSETVNEAAEPSDPDAPTTEITTTDTLPAENAAQNERIYLPLIITSNNEADTAQAAAAPVAPSIGMWINAQEIAKLPMSGAAWTYLKTQADKAVGAVTLSDQESSANVNVMAKALVYARTGTPTYRADVIAALRTLTTGNTEKGARALAVGRELAAYVIAADLINLRSADAALDTQFRAKLRYLLTAPLVDGPKNLITSNELRPNNWGLHAGASRIAVALYLGDKAELDRAALVFQGWLGDRAKYSGFKYGDLGWQNDPSRPVGVNPVGATKAGHSIDGVMPDDMRRGGDFHWPPSATGYPWEGLQGAVMQAELLSRAGYPAWEWQNKAILRSVKFLYAVGWPAVSDDLWQVWIINRAYGTNYATSTTAKPGKNVGWTSWTSAR
jgi:hypothetical protein